MDISHSAIEGLGLPELSLGFA